MVSPPKAARLSSGMILGIGLELDVLCGWTRGRNA